MPELRITVGGREYEVACQEGEEHFLRAASEMLNTEASALVNQIGRMPESRMLLMAGLLLADKTAGVEDRYRAMETKVGAQEAELEQLRLAASGADAAGAQSSETYAALAERYAELAARAEALAAELEEKASAA